ncbi:MAG: alpha/beta hydrolase [Planctomycetota bacterium]|nr:MAG: alpha/beta hydrolase [Planctomycetota bacterium]
MATMSLTPEARAYLDAFKATGTPMESVSPEQARALVAPLKSRKEAVSEIRDIWIPGPEGELSALVYTPLIHEDREDLLPTIVFFHGGGWVVGSPKSHDGMCRRLCNAMEAIVISVDYRLAPENKYPAAAEDCYAATVWASKFIENFNGDPSRLIVCGDSAGGNLAAVVALMARDRGDPAIAAQVLLYPITDHNYDTGSYRDNGKGYFLTTETMKWFWNHYLESPEQGKEPYASPLQADLKGLPPAIVLTAEYDPLRDEGHAYASKLQAAGVTVRRVACLGQVHGFLRRLDLFPAAAGGTLIGVCKQTREMLGWPAVEWTGDSV